MAWTPFGYNTITELLSGKNPNPVANLVGGFTNPGVPMNTTPTSGSSAPLDYSTVQQTPKGPVIPTTTISGGGTLSGTQTQNQIPQSQTQQQNPYSGAEDSARSQAQIELEQALNEFDYQRQGLEAQSGQLDTQRLSALGTLDTERGRAEKEAGIAKTEATSATQTAKSKALSTAQDVQKKNRNVLRALGILSSSAGGEMLAKPMNEFGTQAADLQQGLVDRLGKVEDWWMQRQQDFTKAKTDLETQYANLKENISRDLRFNDRQRLTAVKAAASALSQRIQEIQQQKISYENAAKQYSDNLLLQIAQIKMYQNPTADTSAILNTLLSQAQQGYQGPTAAITQSPEDIKKKQQASLLSGLGTV